ncbi:MAG TPA: DUF481 domain-containing protein, partial [Verrucomicrobiae bacterium]|nr:DUF481 domain-containing protein [Verrucomicrobiae bacterium]
MKKIFIALALAFIALNCRAIVAIPSPAATNRPAWDDSISFGLTLTSGNSDTMLTTAGFKSHYDTKTNELTMSVDGSYGEQSTVENNETAHGVLQYNHLFTARLYGYGRADAFHDGVADVIYRFTPSPGAGYY